MDELCIADPDPTKPSCDFMKRYHEIIFSPEFCEALIHLHKFHGKKPKISAQLENYLKRFENGVQITGMQSIEIRLVTKVTAEPVPGNKSQNNFIGFSRKIKIIVFEKVNLSDMN